MDGALLRSDRFDAYKPLGAGGDPVYRAASPLREALRLQVDRAVADLFAVPRVTDDGDAIDWYAPRVGAVTRWSEATVEQRRSAAAVLRGARQRIESHGLVLQGREGGDSRVFGQLLGKVMQVPSRDHIYLVDGRPVLTFWGFHPLDAGSDFDVIRDLELEPPPPPPPPAAPPIPAVVPEVVPPPAAPGAPVPVPAPPVVAPRRKWGCLLPLLLLPLLLSLLWFTLAHWGVIPSGWPLARLSAERKAPSDPGPVIPPGVAPSTDAPAPTSRTTAGSVGHLPEGGAAGAVPPGGSPPTPPGNQPDVDPNGLAGGEPREGDAASPDVSPPTDASKQPAPTQPEPPPAPPEPEGKPLTVPEDAIDRESTDFLNGEWRSITGLQDFHGNPAELLYRFDKGKGSVSLRRTIDDSPQTCTGSVDSTLKDRVLTFDQRDVKCPDGTRFMNTKIECSVGKDGRAVCKGLNANDSRYDVDMVQ